jgi:hypothetical protein
MMLPFPVILDKTVTYHKDTHAVFPMVLLLPVLEADIRSESLRTLFKKGESKRLVVIFFVWVGS